MIKNLWDGGILKLTVSVEWTDGINWFLILNHLKLVFWPPDSYLMIKLAPKKYPPKTKYTDAS